MPHVFDLEPTPTTAGAAPVTTDAARRARAPHLSAAVVSGLTRLCELAVLIVSGLAVAASWMGPEEAFEDSRYLVAIVLTALAAVAAGQRLDTYTIPGLSQPLRQMPRVLLGWLTAIGALVAMVFLLKAGPEFSRGWLVLWAVAGLAASLALRAGASFVIHGLQQEGRLNRRAVIFGAGEAGRSLVASLEGDHDSDLRICGIFDDRCEARVGASILGYPRLGNVDELVRFCRATPVDLLIVSLPITAEGRLLEILKKLWVLPVDIRLAAQTNKLRFRPRAYSFVGHVPLLDLFDKPLADWDVIVKSTFDRVLATLMLIVLSPLMAAIALAIRLDSRGPVLFRQKRLGFNNRLIEVWKFRSMFTEQSDVDAARLVTKDDPRVTRVGRFIRRTSLDELPQLFNVLTGTLSLVGPRPHALQAKAADRLYHEVVDGYFARHKVKPGITGWAQVNGWRGETDTPEKIRCRVEHDLYYIENWSLLLDLYILARTPLALFKSENAY